MRAYTVMRCKSNLAVELLLSTCFPRHSTILDVTYGLGNFWAGSARRPVGCDLDRSRARDVVADVRHLPFVDNSFDVVLFDPPWLAHTGTPIHRDRFGLIENGEQRGLFVGGAVESYRVARQGIIVKCQDSVNGKSVAWPSFWLYEALGEPFDVMHVEASKKMLHPSWDIQRSVWRNHSTYWVWRPRKTHDGK